MDNCLSCSHVHSNNTSLAIISVHCKPWAYAIGKELSKEEIIIQDFIPRRRAQTTNHPNENFVINAKQEPLAHIRILCLSRLLSHPEPILWTAESGGAFLELGCLYEWMCIRGSLYISQMILSQVYLLQEVLTWEEELLAEC